MLSDLLRASLELGLPVAALSWLLFFRLYSRGQLARDADHKTIHAGVKAIRKTEKESEEDSDSMLHAKWMKFGGGFYGVAAAWTLIYIEASGVIGVILHPSAVLETIHKGFAELIINQVTGQVATLIDAAVWFNWWPEKGHGPVAWFVVAYAGYIAGLNLARFETGLGSRVVGLDSRARWRSLVPFGKGRAEMAKEERGDQAGPPAH